jgi:hypothetical protein
MLPGGVEALPQAIVPSECANMAPSGRIQANSGMPAVTPSSGFGAWVSTIVKGNPESRQYVTLTYSGLPRSWILARIRWCMAIDVILLDRSQS